MSGVWKLEEARLVQERSVSSAANADTLGLGVLVPPGKCWVILAVQYMPDVAETQTIGFYKVTGTGAVFTLLNPLSMALNPQRATFIEQGMEYLLLPGEYLLVRRGGHTAGSTMGLSIQFVEIDLPLYTYDEPQTVKRQARALSSIRSMLGGGVGGGVTRPGTLTVEPGGRSGPLEK